MLETPLPSFPFRANQALFFTHAFCVVPGSKCLVLVQVGTFLEKGWVTESIPLEGEACLLKWLALLSHLGSQALGQSLPCSR